MEELKEKLFVISNNDPVLFEFNLSWLGYCMTGENGTERFLIMVGYSASNGKSTMATMFNKSLPIYSCMINNRTFDKGYEKVHKQLAAVTKIKRFVVMEELSIKKLDGTQLKLFTTGGKFVTEKIFDTQLELDIRAKLYCTSNIDPSFDTDEGIRRREILETLYNKFVPKDEYESTTNKIRLYIRDTDLKKNFDTPEYQLTFIQLLIPYACAYYESGLIIPQSLDEQFNTLCDENDEIKTFIDQYITHDKYSCISKDVFITEFNKKMNTQFTLNYLIRKSKTHSTYQKDKRCSDSRGAFLGIKFKEKPVVNETNKLNDTYGDGYFANIDVNIYFDDDSCTDECSGDTNYDYDISGSDNMIFGNKKTLLMD